MTEGLAGLARRARAQASAFVTDQADAAGLRTLPWMALAILAMVELAGVAPAVAGWTRPDPSVVSGIARGTDYLWRHATPLLTGVVDPLLGWTTALVPPSWAWARTAAVPVLLVTCLAVTRQHRGRTTNSRALRLAAVLVGRVVMVAYLVHLVATRLAPVAIGAMTVNLALLAVTVGGTAIVFRLGAGGRPDEPPPSRNRLRSASHAVAVMGVVATAGLAVQAVPLPPFWPVAELSGAAAPASPRPPGQAAIPSPPDSHGALIRESHAFLATSTPGAIDVTAVDLATRQQVWRQQVSPLGDPTAMTPFRLLSSTGVLYVQILATNGTGPSFALNMSDGRVLWTRATGIIHGFQNVVLHVESAKGTLAAVNGLTGTPLWTRRHPAGTALRWQAPSTVLLDTSSLTIAHVIQVERNGTVRVLRTGDGRVLAERAGLVKDGHPVWPIADHLVWTEGTGGTGGTDSRRLVAYAVGNLGQPVWQYAAPPGAGEPSSVAYCGPDRICLAGPGGAYSVDTRTGALAWRLDGAQELAFGVPNGDVMVWSATGTTMLDRRGTVVARFPGERGFPLDATRILLLTAAPGDTGDRRRDIALFHLAPRLRQPLGHTRLDLAACAWSDAYLACAGPSSRRLWELRG